MELPSLDLNLLIVLHALLEERNVTRAGERVGLSQPGTSAALARLRRHFDDQLLERTGTSYELTPLARALQSQVRDTIQRLQLVLNARPDFDPATSERQWVVQCSDSVQSLIGPAVVREVVTVSPLATLDFQPLDPRFAHDPLAAARDIDVMIAPRGLFSAPTLQHLELYRDRWVCITSADNTTVGESLTAEEVSAARWVVSFRDPPMNSPADAALSALGIDRRSTVKVQSLTLLHRMVQGTDLLVLAHEAVAGDLTAQGLRRVELPAALPPIIETAWSHPSRQLDPGHHWLLGVLQRAAAQAPVAVPA
ncbi:LysR family transcriptional regulator [Modestobacter sp. NPDC049651]|uniref:LysR family transcriptional regulator n=1 Tax=unclassified Modestobacter TaxID=2643866 RepID=UPI0033CCB47E